MKLLLIKSCFGCPFHKTRNGLEICKKRTDTANWLHDYPDIPDWCPLEEEGED